MSIFVRVPRIVYGQYMNMWKRDQVFNHRFSLKQLITRNISLISVC